MNSTITYAGTKLPARNLEVTAGEELRLTVELLGTDCSGGVITLCWGRVGGAVISTEVAGDASGVHVIILSSAITQLLDGRYRWDVWYEPADSAPVQLVAPSVMQIAAVVGPGGTTTPYTGMTNDIAAVRYGAPRVYATCADARTNADPTENPTILVVGRGAFTWTASAGTDTGTEATAYIAGTGGGFQLEHVLYRDFTANTPAVELPGRTFWDGKTLCYNTPYAGTTCNIGQEEHVPVWNSSGSPLADGAVVYANSGHADLVDVRLAQNGVNLAGKILGLTTMLVGNNAEGLVTTFGLVHGLNTQAFSDGQEVYTSGVAGGLSATKPTGDVDGARIGIVTNASPSQGSIFVFPRVLPKQGGTTANRPSSPRLGDMYFDTTITRPIWWTGSVWVDSDGVTR